MSTSDSKSIVHPADSSDPVVEGAAPLETLAPLKVADLVETAAPLGNSHETAASLAAPLATSATLEAADLVAASQVDRQARRWSWPKRQSSDLLKAILLGRGYLTDEAQAEFLHPEYERLSDPSLILNAEAAAGLILSVIQSGQPIAIFGDYDHDGTPAAALLGHWLKRLGANLFDIIIPERHEGYGLNQLVIDRLIAHSVKLLITVDCGITSRSELAEAAAHGLQSIVIDHHLPVESSFPDAAIVVNLKQAGETSPDRDLAAAGLAWQLTRLIVRRSGQFDESQLKWDLDLVAIATICDLVPLTGANRILAHYGLLVLTKTRRPGLRALINRAGLTALPELESAKVAWQLGPRLNAPSRLGAAQLPLQLLMSTDIHEAEALAEQIEQHNLERQAKTQAAIRQAEALIASWSDLPSAIVISAPSPDWPEGILGLIASRLLEKYRRPVMVLSVNAELKLARGSARAPEPYNLVTLFEATSQHLIKFGGHARAAGLSLEPGQLESFTQAIIIACDQIKEQVDTEKTEIIRGELLVQANELTLESYQRLRALEPTGMANPEPELVLSPAQLLTVERLGQLKEHARLAIEYQGQRFSLIYFNPPHEEQWQIGQMYDWLIKLKLNHFRGETRLDLVVRASQLSQTDLTGMTDG